MEHAVNKYHAHGAEIVLTSIPSGAVEDLGNGRFRVRSWIRVADGTEINFRAMTKEDPDGISIQGFEITEVVDPNAPINSGPPRTTYP
jgi:hypothetical protein